MPNCPDCKVWPCKCPARHPENSLDKLERAWAEDEQQKRHSAEEKLVDAHSEIAVKDAVIEKLTTALKNIAKVEGDTMVGRRALRAIGHG